MRYQLNEEIFVIHFDYASLRAKEEKFQAADFYLPFVYGREEIPSEIDLELLTVTEHHLVPWDQDPKQEKKYDGYLLKDSQGEILSNQYPRASYGQTTDTGDRQFKYHFADDADYDPIFKTFNDGTRKVYQYALLSGVIENMTEGLINCINKLQDHQNISDEDKIFYAELKGRLTQVLMMIKDAFKEKYPDWKYETKRVPLVEGMDYHVCRCIFTKI